MHAHKDTAQNVTHRIKIARGHLDKVLRMVEEGNYCIDVITQSKAVQHALKEVDYLLLENHLQTCVVELVKDGRKKDAIDEVMRVFKNNTK